MSGDPDPRASAANRGLKVHAVNAGSWVRLDHPARRGRGVPKGHRAYQLRALSVQPGQGASQDHRGFKGIGGQLDHAVSTAMMGLAASGATLVKSGLVVLPVNRGLPVPPDRAGLRDRLAREVSGER